MQRVVLRYALRFSAQIRHRTQNQLRRIHQEGSNSPHQKNVNPSSNVREYVQSAPINMSHFKALIQPPDSVARKRYRLRWDWHLRNFLVSLLPPAALWVFIKLIQWRLGEYLEDNGHLLPEDEFSKGRSSRTATNAENQVMQRNLKTALNAKILDRLERLEKEMDQLRSQRSAVANDSPSQEEPVNGVGEDALAKARKISKTIVRRGFDPG